MDRSCCGRRTAVSDRAGMASSELHPPPPRSLPLECMQLHIHYSRDVSTAFACDFITWCSFLDDVGQLNTLLGGHVPLFWLEYPCQLNSLLPLECSLNGSAPIGGQSRRLKVAQDGMRVGSPLLGCLVLFSGYASEPSAPCLGTVR